MEEGSRGEEGSDNSGWGALWQKERCQSDFQRRLNGAARSPMGEPSGTKTGRAASTPRANKQNTHLEAALVPCTAAQRHATAWKSAAM